MPSWISDRAKTRQKWKIGRSLGMVRRLIFPLHHGPIEFAEELHCYPVNVGTIDVVVNYVHCVFINAIDPW